MKPPYNLCHLDPSETMDLALSLLEAAGQQGADLALLSKSFAAAGLPSHRIAEVAEPIPGPAFDKIAACAARHRMNVVAGILHERWRTRSITSRPSIDRTAV